MNLCSPREVSALLQAHGIHPSKVLGQNFLVDRNILSRIVEAGEISPGTRVLEVGPGLGVLTEAMLEAGAVLTFIEKDPCLRPLLEERFGNNPNCIMVFGDALEKDIAGFFASGITHLVSNLPYSVGTRIVVEAARCHTPPQQMTLLLQKEVCQRFAARENTADRGAISVWLQRLYDVTLVRDVPPGCFVPRPEVTSSIVSLKRHDRHPLPPEQAETFYALTKAAFLHRRKQLAASMRSAGALSKPAGETRALLSRIGASETARAEELSLTQWLELSALWFLHL